ncbi:MAG: hypothetical protein NW200_15305 [Hyphomonadaceae bacterium]|nr:hypothetical protein [Hyphomonadaceae bacterium]
MNGYIIGALAMASATLAPSVAAARPVTYPGGTMSMAEHRDEATMVETVHTLSPRLGVGWHDEWDHEDDWQFHGPMIAGLARRWNMPDAQANIFWMAGAGAAFDDVASAGGPAKPAAYASVEADWENRRFYTQYQARAFWAEDIDRTFTQRWRAGVAPYVAEAGALHAWAILQVDHEPEDADPVSLTPMVRVFKGAALAEAGVSLDGDAFAAFMIYF